MAHEHHHHDHTVTSLNKAFILGIALNVAFVVVEFAVGLYYGSMGLLSDAGHNLSDVASLLLAMLAFRLAQAHATPRYTYGYKKSTVLISLLNSVILLIAVGVIVHHLCLQNNNGHIRRGNCAVGTHGTGHLQEGVHRVHTLGDFAECSVLLIQERAVRVADKELA